MVWTKQSPLSIERPVPVFHYTKEITLTMTRFTTILLLGLILTITSVFSKSNGFYRIATKLTPKNRPTVSPEFADSYWIPGTFFNSKNFKGKI